MQTQFVQVGERRVFVRHAGRGPALLLLHQSPQSSAALLPMIEHFADRYAVFAPDTPGFGLSDPLPLGQPTIPDLAQALGALVQALRLQRVLLYGVHTGASIAARLARDQPELVAALVCDGLSAFNAEERRPLLDGYLPPLEPSWDGSHLRWLWARMREQKLFFPWQAGTAAARIPYPLPTPAQIHADVMELLDAGDGYRAGYRAPLLYEHGAASAAELRVPAWLLYRKADVLRPHLERLPQLPPHVHALEVTDAAALLRQTEAAFASVAERAAHEAAAPGGAAAAVPAASTAASAMHAASWADSAAAVAQASAATRRVVPTSLGALAFWCQAGTPEVAELSLCDIGTPAALPANRSPGVLALALDLPGHGATPRLPLAAIEDHRWLGAVVEALNALGVGQLRMAGHGGACAFAAVLARRLGPRCQALTLHDALPLSPAERQRFFDQLPLLHADAAGSHLLSAWDWARLKCLFWPWLVPDAAAVIVSAAPPPYRVHAEVVEMMRAQDNFGALWQAALNSDLPALLAAVTAPLSLHVSSLARPLGHQARLLANPSPGMEGSP